jgi:hypothetical protein
VSVLDAADRTAVLEIDAARRADSGRYPAANRSAQKRGGLRQLYEPVLVDLVVLQSDPRQLAIRERAAIEEEPGPARPVRLRPSKIDTHEPPADDLEAALLSSLTYARLPRRLPTRVDLAPGDRLALLVVGFQNQQSPCVVEDQRAR